MRPDHRQRSSNQMRCGVCLLEGPGQAQTSCPGPLPVQSRLLLHLSLHVRQQVLSHQSPHPCLHLWPLSQEPQRTQSHLTRGKHDTAVQDLPRVEHRHQAAPTTRSHPLRCRKHVVICASHADRQGRGTRWQLAITTVAGAGSSADPHSCNPKIRGKGQGREGEATPPGPGRPGLGIHRTTHVAGVLSSTEPGKCRCWTRFCCQLPPRQPFR